jgi:probable aminopeptidase NPEPL1
MRPRAVFVRGAAKNTSAVSNGPSSLAQSSCAAQFIANNLDADYTGAWVHVDMAAPVHVGDRATGYGVALLVDLFARAKAR